MYILDNPLRHDSLILMFVRITCTSFHKTCTLNSQWLSTTCWFLSHVHLTWFSWGSSTFWSGPLEHTASKATALGHKKHLRGHTCLCSEVTHITSTYNPLARSYLITETCHKGGPDMESTTWMSSKCSLSFASTECLQVISHVSIHR